MAKKNDSIPTSALEAAQIELKEFVDALPTKQYIVEWNTETVNELLNYFENEISWKFNESIGVEKAHKFLSAAKAESKQGHILLDSLTIQALYVFISRKEGKGLDEAKKFYHNILKPISEAIRRTQIDAGKAQDLENKVKELKVGSEPQKIVGESLDLDLTKEETSQVAEDQA